MAGENDISGSEDLAVSRYVVAVASSVLVESNETVLD